jgi:hypothetical protein
LAGAVVGGSVMVHGEVRGLAIGAKGAEVVGAA